MAQLVVLPVQVLRKMRLPRPLMAKPVVLPSQWLLSRRLSPPLTLMPLWLPEHRFAKMWQLLPTLMPLLAFARAVLQETMPVPEKRIPTVPLSFATQREIVPPEIRKPSPVLWAAVQSDTALFWSASKPVSPLSPAVQEVMTQSEVTSMPSAVLE